MSFHKILNKIRSENILFSVLLELTYQCNLDCFFCYNNVKLKGTPFRTEQYVQLFHDLRDMEVMELMFSGGEPLMHKDFIFLGRKAYELGFIIRLKSNGHDFSKQLARQVKDEISPFIVDISLHGASPETHDRQTRRPGSFNRLMKNLQDMIEIGLRIKLSMTLTAWNEHEIEQMIGLADKLGVIFQVNTQITPKDDGNLNPLSIAPSPEGIQRTLRLLDAYIDSQTNKRNLDMEKLPSKSDNSLLDCDSTANTEKICGIGSSSVTIDPFGNVLPCPQWRQSAGNLHHQSIQDIWFHSQTLEKVRLLAIKAKQMVESYGADGEHMAFCLGQAAKQGNPLQPYEQALTQMELRKKRHDNINHK